MKSILCTLAFVSTAVLAQGAFAVEASAKKGTHPSCLPVPAGQNAYQACHLECGPGHDSGGGMYNTTCINDCLAKYCK